MKNVFKILGILCIIAAAVFITACPPGEEDNEFTVTFNSNGGTPVAPQKVPKDGFATSATTSKSAYSEPTGVTATSFYQLVSTAPTFTGWYLDGELFEVSTTPITKNIILIAQWSGGEPTNLTSSLTGNNDIISTAVNYVNNNGNDANKYILFLDDKVTATQNAILNWGELTIKSTSATEQRTIKSPKMTGTYAVYLTVGESEGESTKNPKLNLVRIIVEGYAGVNLNGDINATTADNEISDSLIRIRGKGKLTLGDNSVVQGHKNKATDAGGSHGNGSAVCVVDDGVLDMIESSIITQNESTQNSATTGNRNRVGGVYTFGRATLNINGGVISGNKCTSGNTEDVYATEGGTFNLSGNVVIKEITLNGGTSAGDNGWAAITVSSLGDYANVHLSLRSTLAASAVGANWKTNPNPVLKAKTGTLSANDIGKFYLKQFKGFSGEPVNIPETYSIGSDGKLVGP